MFDARYLERIKSFEGYTPVAKADYGQFSVGYGTKARFAGERIDPLEAERRFSSEIKEAATLVDKFAGKLDPGSRAALTSLTYNAGTAWMTSGLGAAVQKGDLDEVRRLFVLYNKAGGEVLPGLVNRRQAEVAWIGNPSANGGVAAFGSAAPQGTSPAGAEPVVDGRESTYTAGLRPPRFVAAEAEAGLQTRSAEVDIAFEQLMNAVSRIISSNTRVAETSDTDDDKKVST